MRRYTIAPLLCLLFLCSCSIQGGHTSYNVTPLKKGDVLQAQAKIYIMHPKDFTKGDKTELETGAQVQKEMVAALSVAPGERIAASVPQDKAASFAAARASGCAYLIDMDIIDWEDPPAAFQYRSDRGELTLSVYDAISEKLLRSDNLGCNGSATTVNAIGSYTPIDCLKPAFQKWVSSAVAGAQ